MRAGGARAPLARSTGPHGPTKMATVAQRALATASLGRRLRLQARAAAAEA